MLPGVAIGHGLLVIVSSGTTDRIAGDHLYERTDISKVNIKNH